MCKKCQEYVHTVTHCTADQPRCGYCAGNHIVETYDTTKVPAKYANCEGPHSLTSVECKISQKENEIKHAQLTKKVDR